MSQSLNTNSMGSNFNIKSIPREEFRKIEVEDINNLQCMFDVEFHDEYKGKHYLANNMYRIRSSSIELDPLWHVKKQCKPSKTHLEIPRGSTSAEYTKHVPCSIINIALPHSEVQNKYIRSSNVQMETTSQLSYFKDLKCFKKNLHFNSLIQFTEKYTKNWIISKSNLPFENNFATSYDGLMDLNSMFNTEDTLYKNSLTISEPQKFNDPHNNFQELKKEILNKYKRKPACFFQFNCPSSCPADIKCDIKDSSWKHNEDTYKVQKLRNAKRKIPKSISEDNEQRAKIPLNIYTCRNDIFTEAPDTNLNFSVEVQHVKTVPYTLHKNTFWFYNKISDNEVSELPTYGTYQHKGQGGSVRNIGKFCSEVKISSKEYLMQQTFNLSKVHQKFSGNVQKYKTNLFSGSAVVNLHLTAKDSVLLQVLFCDIPGIFATSLISQNDGNCLQMDQYRNLYFSNVSNRKAAVNNKLHADLSFQKLLTISNIVSKSRICSPQNEDNKFSRAEEKRSCQQKSRISADILRNPLKHSALEKSNIMLPYIDVKTCLFCLFGSNVESFILNEKTFSTQLNYTRQPEEQHFLSNILFSIPPASLQATPKNEFLPFTNNSLQNTSELDIVLETIFDGSNYSFIDTDVKLENISLETCSAEHTNTQSEENATFQQYRLTKDQSQNYSLHNGDFSDFFFSRQALESSNFQFSPKQISFIETYDKITLDPAVVETCKDDNQKTDTFSYQEHISYIAKYSGKFDKTGKKHSSQLASITPDNYAYTLDISDPKHKTAQEVIPREAFKKETQYKRFCNNDTPYTAAYPNVFCALQKGVPTNVFVNLEPLPDEIVTPHKENIPYTVPAQLQTSQLGNITFPNTEEHSYILSDVERIAKTSGHFRPVIPENTVSFEMKAQFDLVLEELAMFHAISGKQETEMEGLEITLVDLPDNLNKGIKCDPEHVASAVMGKTEIHGISTAGQRKSSKEIPSQVREHVPRVYSPSGAGEEEPLCNVKEDSRKTYSWKPAFLPCHNTEGINELQSQKEGAFSLGIGRVAPLKTCTGPLRIGLSKKGRIKQLHPYLR